jgi:tRNA isopentenyl-2-thiomethyl-A-37 hydroxylase MiaE
MVKAPSYQISSLECRNIPHVSLPPRKASANINAVIFHLEDKLFIDESVVDVSIERLAPIKNKIEEVRSGQISVLNHFGY